MLCIVWIVDCGKNCLPKDAKLRFREAFGPVKESGRNEL